MDAFRHGLGILLWVSFPPLLGFWLLVHPFVHLWRRLGALVSYGVLLSLVAAAMVGLYALRAAVFTVDLGTRPLVVAAGITCLVLAAAARLPIERALTTRALLGLPELAPERHATGLVTTGPYRFVRHPRYLQVSVALLGWALLSNFLVCYGLVALWLPALWLLVTLEERELRERFGPAWDDYARRVPRFVPRRR